MKTVDKYRGCVAPSCRGPADTRLSLIRARCRWCAHVHDDLIVAVPSFAVGIFYGINAHIFIDAEYYVIGAFFGTGAVTLILFSMLGAWMWMARHKTPGHTTAPK